MMLLIGAHLREGDIEGAVSVQSGSLFISTIEVADDQPTAEPELVRRVAMLRHALTLRETFVAFRYGAKAHSVTEVREKCGPHEANWRALLERWRGHVELTLKIAPPTKAARPRIGEVQGGADYLRQLAAARLQPLDDGDRSAAEAAFVGVAAAARWMPRSDGGWEYAVLARRESLAQLGNISEGLRATLKQPFLLSGPWPLEVFANE